MEKIYRPINVYDALQNRLDFIFSEFDNIYISFSGGKDSGLLLNLVLQYMQQHGIQRPIGLFHQDFEAQYTATAEYVERTFSSMPDFVEKFWVCLPMAVRNAMSQTDPWWYPWDPDKKDIWVRKMPEYPYVLNLDTQTFDFYKFGMLQDDLYKQFGRWYGKHCGGGKTISLLGIRSDESLHRYSAIVNKRHPYNGIKWISQKYKDVYSASPLYDWCVDDVWIANGKFGFDYNRLYDLYNKAGVPLAEMRVASPFIEWAGPALNLYRIIEPEMWSRVVGRVNGANFGAIYGATKAMGYHDVTLPQGHTWKSYTMFLLSTLPPNIRDSYLEKFKTSMAFWAKTGGGFSDDVKSTIDIPSWKRMCCCILKNDYLCRFMGFGTTKLQAERIKKIKSKYAALIRGKEP